MFTLATDLNAYIPIALLVVMAIVFAVANLAILIDLGIVGGGASNRRFRRYYVRVD